MEVHHDEMLDRPSSVSDNFTVTFQYPPLKLAVAEDGLTAILALNFFFEIGLLFTPFHFKLILDVD